MLVFEIIWYQWKPDICSYYVLQAENKKEARKIFSKQNNPEKEDNLSVEEIDISTPYFVN